MSFASLERTWTKEKSLPCFAESEDEPPAKSTSVYVITGFLDSGKTTLINALLRLRQAKEKAVCCLQFERGDTELVSGAELEGSFDVLAFSIRDIQTDADAAAKQIQAYLLRHQPDELWIEWNGMLPFEQLQELFTPTLGQNRSADVCRIKKVVYIANAARMEDLISRTGGVTLGQISNADLVVLRHCRSAPEFRRLKRMAREANPGVRALPFKPLRSVERQIDRPRLSPHLLFLFGIIYFVVAYIFLRFGMGLQGVSPDTVINVFLGILLQALPFLLVGVLLSSAIQVFVSQQFIERRFPKSRLGGMLFAILAGFCLPVCDCASIPIFQSLVRKGVPVSVAVTFMAATPVINPVVILSTWYAFNGNVRMVLCRVGLGILCAVLVGLTFSKSTQKSVNMSGGFSGTLCACGCYSGKPPSGWRGKAALYIRHAQAEFFNVGKYLLLGAFVSALFQTLGSNIAWPKGNSGLLVSLLIMMGMAFFLSLCSSSDAVVARSFAGQFPTGALLGFLVFGPMMDVKNVILLSGGFSKKFILRLALTMFLVCGTVVFLAFHFGLERILL